MVVLYLKSDALNGTAANLGQGVASMLYSAPCLVVAGLLTQVEGPRFVSL